MKILVASDIHGSSYYADLLIKKAEEIRPLKTILLGDLYYHGPRNELPKEYDTMKVATLLNDYSKYHDMIVIKGNCDAEVDEMISEFEFLEESVIEEFGMTFTLSHGHKTNLQNLGGVNTDVLLYGHFHVPFIEDANGILVASPGSTSLPKENSKNSYMIITADGIVIYDLLTDEVILERKFVK